jgi:hypothetical protein
VAVTYPTATANNRLRMAFLNGAVTPAAGESVDAGAGVGVLVIGTSALSGATGVLASIALLKPCVSISGKVATILGVPLSANATAAGVAALAEIRDSAGNVIVGGLTVGGTAEGTAAGKDVVLNASTLANGETVVLSSGTISHP